MDIKRTNIKTIGIWTLQRREFEEGEYDYFIKSENSSRSIDLFVNERKDYKTGRTAFTLEYSHFSKQMTLEEAAWFVEQAKQTLEVAREFQDEIDSYEGVLNPVI